MTLADYTFNYTVFSLLTAGRLTSLWTALRPESSGLVSGACSRKPLKSCSLSAFSPEPKDKPGLGEALACLEQTAAETAQAEARAAPSLPQSPSFPGSLLLAEMVSDFRCLSLFLAHWVTYFLVLVFSQF